MTDFLTLCERIRSKDSSSAAAGDELVRILEVSFLAGFQTYPAFAKDLMQELLLTVYKAIMERRVALDENKVEHPERLIFYAGGIANHLKMDAAKRTARAINKLVPINTLSIRANQESNLMRKENYAIFLDLMKELTELERIVIERRCFRTETYEQIYADLNPAFDVNSVEHLRVIKSRTVKKLQDEYRIRTQVRPDPDGGIVALLAA